MAAPFSDLPPVTGELLAREASFRERQGRVVRATVTFGMATVLGIALLAAAVAVRPESAPAAAVTLLVAIGAAALNLRRCRNLWRCPDCEARWELSDAFASFFWNHCPACGVWLRTDPQRSAQEREALSRSRDVPHAELVARAQRWRRRSWAGGGVVGVAGIAALLAVQGRGWGETAQEVLGATVAGATLAIVLLGSRCPRCARGLLTGRASHCQRCGFVLDAGEGPDPK